MATKISIKAGDTFKYLCTVGGLTGTLSGWSIRSQIRQKGALIDELKVTVTGDTTFTVEESAAGVTANWPVTADGGLASVNGLVWDIRLTDPNTQVMTTETREVEVIEQQTPRGAA